MQKVKLIHLGKYYHPVPGGMETHLYDSCNQLKDTFDLRVLVANTGPRTVAENVEGVSVTRVANWGELFSCPICPTLPYHLSKLHGQVDTIVQIHLPNPMAHMAYRLTEERGRLVVTWHSDIIRQKFISRAYRRHLFDLLHRADCIVASSPNYIQSSPFLKAFTQKCRVVPLGIDAKKFAKTEEVRNRAAAIRRQYGGRIVLFVGRFIYYKGLPVLLRAAPEIDARILLIGDGPLKARLQSEIACQGLQGKVDVLSGVSNSELAAYYHASDVFVLPSNQRSEAFGIVQLEAMACGKPVVSTNLTTGVPWVNRHGETGLVVPKDSPERLAGAVNYLLKHEEERRILGRNGRRRVLSHFTLTIVTAAMEKVYEQVLNGNANKPARSHSVRRPNVRSMRTS